MNGDEEEKVGLLNEEGGVSVLDFDMLCSAVAAMQNQGKCKWVNTQDQDYGDADSERGGVLRMWEGDVFDCFDDSRILLESSWYDFLVFGVFCWKICGFLLFCCKVWVLGFFEFLFS